MVDPGRSVELRALEVCAGIAFTAALGAVFVEFVAREGAGTEGAARAAVFWDGDVTAEGVLASVHRKVIRDDAQGYIC